MRNRLLSLKVEENICIDDHIIHFKGILSAEIYIKDAHKLWGLKVYYLCSESGQPYDIFLYQGSSTELNPENVKNMKMMCQLYCI